MNELLVHRGPDAGGEHVSARAALGIRRLRVIDLVTGDQPMTNEDRTVWTVFNGEIYNFRALRNELAARGHRLATASDTETIVHLYEDDGPGFVKRLDGMFALAVWDETRGTLVLARDRLGKKPLLYCERNGELSFASEHRALLTGLDPKPGVEASAIRRYLRLGYIPAPDDAFSGVRKLPPGHLLVWCDGRSELRRYWSPPPPGERRISATEAASETRRLFTEAVRKRLVADVPLGAFLSGGIDSSVLVATMATLTSRVRTFSIGFDESAYSELSHARRVAERFGTEHHELVVRPLEHLDVLPLLARHYGEPFADSSALPTYHLARMTREHVTVALAGDGGDEAFVGYDRYRAARLAAAMDRIPAFVRLPALAAMRRALPNASSARGRLGRAGRFVRAATLAPGARYDRWTAIFAPEELEPLLDPDFAQRTATVESGSDGRFAGHDPVASAQRVDIERYLPDDLLVKVDIASMANSLEIRAPFLDHELVEFALGLPTALTLRGTTGKHVLRQAFADLVPAENLARRKQGFGVPLAAWFRGALAPMARETLLDPRARARGYFRGGAVATLLDEHVACRADHGAHIWSLLMLELWHREVVDA